MTNIEKTPVSRKCCAGNSCCHATISIEQPVFVTIPQVATQLSFYDKLGSWKARWSDKQRMNYKVSSGLYKVGNPDPESPVLVTANYKMSFDRLRCELRGFKAVVAGTVLVPVLLPYIPGRALSWKGWLLGLIWAGVCIWFSYPATDWLQDEWK